MGGHREDEILELEIDVQLSYLRGLLYSLCC